jgi:predicted metal-dependent hydrolase
LASPRLIQVDIEGVKVPIKVIPEPRRNGRVAFGKRFILLRYPDSIFSRGETFYINWAKEWLKERYQAKPSLFQRYTGGNIEDRNKITIYGIEHSLEFNLVARKAGRIDWDQSQGLLLSIPEHLNPFDQVEMRRKLLSKFTAKRFLPEVTDRVHQINDQHFGKEIQFIKLKYNRSNWGSCSSKNNINLSTRLLLAPDAAIDYVIIHELCHLIEMNHSPAFYNEVQSRCPNYRKQERWLRENYCDF